MIEQPRRGEAGQTSVAGTINAQTADVFTEAYTAAGGNSTIVNLPEEGIYGNDHFMFQDLNNDVIADHVENWIQENVE